MGNMIYIGLGIVFFIIGLILILIKNKEKKEVTVEETKIEVKNDEIEEEPLLKKKTVVMDKWRELRKESKGKSLFFFIKKLLKN